MGRRKQKQRSLSLEVGAAPLSQVQGQAEHTCAHTRTGAHPHRRVHTHTRAHAHRAHPVTCRCGCRLTTRRGPSGQCDCLHRPLSLLSPRVCSGPLPAVHVSGPQPSGPCQSSAQSSGCGSDVPPDVWLRFLLLPGADGVCCGSWGAAAGSQRGSASSQSCVSRWPASSLLVSVI